MTNSLRQAQTGFSLMELMIAAGIIVLLGMIAIPAFNGYVDRSRVVSSIADIGKISLDIDKFRLANDDDLPASLADIDADGITDPWGTPYEYVVLTGPGKGSSRKDKNLNPINTDYDLYSKGRDGLSVSSLVPEKSQDDVIRASNGAFVGLAIDF